MSGAQAVEDAGKVVFVSFYQVRNSVKVTCHSTISKIIATLVAIRKSAA